MSLAGVSHPAAAKIHAVAAADGYRLHARVWTPQGSPRARILLLHGIISHAGWYQLSCQRLAQAGVETHFLDRRGSGLNAAARGDVEEFETWLADVEHYAAQLPGDVPRLLAGISWGGKLAAAVARHRGELFNGLVLITPGVAALTRANSLERFALHCAGRLGFGQQRVAIPLQDAALFTDVPGWQQYIRTDPLTLRQITIRFALADLALERYASEAAEQIHLPTLTLLAGRDRIIDNLGVRRFHERLAAADKRLIEYPEAPHTLEFEPDPEPYLSELADWTERLIIQHDIQHIIQHDRPKTGGL
jgi:alpha-beta hydrolase superfamily lysophospholipase